MPGCMERALREAMQKTGPATQANLSGHRIPLGLVLLSRRQLTAEQLQTALAAQQAAGRGRIGEWLQAMGFVSEWQVTAALARQWSCPVLQTNTSMLHPVLIPEVPLRLMDSFHMMPVSFVAATATLHIAFGTGVDYSVLYAIEQMLDCRTQPCMVSPTLLRESLLALDEYHPATEVVFDRVSSVAECVDIVSNYAVRVAACEIRLASCQPYSWVRLKRDSHQTLNLLLRMPSDPYSRPCNPLASAPAV